MMRDVPLENIKGIGPRRQQLFGSLGLFSVCDILRYVPRSYQDYSHVTPVSALVHGDDAALCVRLIAPPKLFRVRRGLDILTVSAQDETGNVVLTWYNQSYRRSQLTQGDTVYACGRVDRLHGIKLVNPAIYASLPGILPVYPLIKGLNQKLVRDTVRACLDAYASGIEETLCESIRKKYALCPLAQATQSIHFPGNFDELKCARRRLAFEDALKFRLMIGIMRAQRESRPGIAFDTRDTQKSFIKLLEYAPTGAQTRIMGEIAADMQKRISMNRLIQGDVGSGKTLLSMYAMYVARKNGYQSVMMAPTEILAAQHYETLKKVFGESAVLITGGMKKSERDEAQKRILSGEASVIVGTHALISEGAQYSRLGLVITDEQHRFGVRARAAISAKGETPDVMIMSATPIPRTLALIMYGELDVSIVDELPPGRQKIKTHIIPPDKRDDMYAFIEREAHAGNQSYVVCPIIEKSDVLEDVMSASELYKELKKKLSARVALLHGQTAQKERDETMRAFSSGDIDVLVSTTVVEVGVDVKNATVMAIENAERFGLAQLHQLRGRVGRGAKQSYCFLLSSASAQNAAERLKLMSQTSDGFLLAERDLEMRGPGEFLGVRQHGLSEFSALSLAMDMDALNMARECAEWILADEGLKKESETLIAEVKRLYEEKSQTVAPN